MGSQMDAIVDVYFHPAVEKGDHVVTCDQIKFLYYIDGIISICRHAFI